MPRLAHLALVLVAVGVGPRPLVGEDEARKPHAYLDLSQARVLASPGWPAALEGFLPPGRKVEPLTLPLPPGPLLVLGIATSDPAARRLAERRLGTMQARGLRGGYLVEAREEQGRALALLLGDDAAALAAARFDLETFTPEAKAGAARSLDMTQPDEQGGVRIAVGRNLVQPRFRLRALGGLEHQGSLLDAASAHANRLWLATPRPVSVGRPRSLALLEEQGVAPVAWSEVTPHGGDLADATTRALDDFKAWQSEGVRHFALLLPRLADLDARATRAAHAGIVRAVVPGLRAGGLAEILVVPPATADPTTWPDLRGIPEALLGWYGAGLRPLRVTRAEAQRVACLAGVPVVFVETWMGDVWGLPSLPRDRDADLGEALAGIVVLPGAGALEAVAQAWTRQSAQATLGPALDELLDCCIADPSDAEAWLLAGAANLEQSLEGRFGAPLWQRDFPRRMRDAATQLPPADQRLLAWFDPEARRPDGSLDPACWDAAPLRTLGPADVRAVSDGERLVLRVRVPRAAQPTRLALSVAAHLPETTLVVNPALEANGRSAMGPWSVRHDASHIEVVASVDRSALHGDPHPGRVVPFTLDLTTAAGEHRLAPGPRAAGAPPPQGALIIVR